MKMPIITRASHHYPDNRHAKQATLPISSNTHFHYQNHLNKSFQQCAHVTYIMPKNEHIEIKRICHSEKKKLNPFQKTR